MMLSSELIPAFYHWQACRLVIVGPPWRLGLNHTLSREHWISDVVREDLLIEEDK
jgi:hypothetical protein